MNTIQEMIVKQVPAKPASFRAGAAGAARLAWIDLAKGIGIALVVIGHACAEASSIGAHYTCDTIYLFHMPLFFMVAGYLAKAGPIKEYAQQRLHALIVPYLCYLFVIGIPVAMGTHQLHGRSAWFEFALYFYGGQHLVTYMTVFWFVTCLFFAQIIFRAMLRISTSPYDWRILGIIAVCCLYSYGFLPKHNVITPLAVSVVPMAVVFLWFGKVYRSVENRSLAVIGACLIAMLGLSLYLQDFPLYRLDMKSGKFGPLFPGLSSAVALSFLLFELCKRFAANRFLVACISPFGQASLTIMFLAEPIRRLLLQADIPAAATIVAALVLPVILHKLFEKNELLGRMFLGQRMPRAVSSLQPGIASRQ
jgi:fucose 4-O-acetylase-like acetyltransferase